MTWRQLIPLAVLALPACLPQVGERFDGGDPALGGTDGGGADGGLPLTCSDGQRDGTETDVDCGGACAPCALARGCTSPRDCTSGVCSLRTCALPADPCAPAFAGCGTGANPWIDATQDANPVVTFPTGDPFAYSPRCMRVRLGQTVTFQGDFFSHPLNSACGPVASGLPGTSSGGVLPVTLDRALGTYGYYCGLHGRASGSGMAGAIDVVR
jgi:plastocyanin